MSTLQRIINLITIYPNANFLFKGNLFNITIPNQLKKSLYSFLHYNTWNTDYTELLNSIGGKIAKLGRP